MFFWSLVTSVGDAGLMVPGAVLLSAGLLAAKAKPAAQLWIGLLLAAGLLCIATKIAFIGWGIGIHRFDFTGISGHSMLSMAVIPVAFFLLAGEGFRNRLLFAALGVLLAVAIAYSRVMLRFHSPFEALTGVALGLIVAGGFLYHGRQIPVGARLANMPLLSVGLVVVLIIGYGRPAPSQDLITRAALMLSGHEKPVTRREWWAEGARKASLRALQNDGALAPHARQAQEEREDKNGTGEEHDGRSG